MTKCAASDFKSDLARLIPNLRAFAGSLCGNSALADDLVQDALLNAWRARSGFVEGSNLKAWVFTILRNTFLSYRRKHKREVEDIDGMYSANLPTDGGQRGRMDLLDFENAFRDLPSDQREALVLIGIEGFSYEEAADVCGCPVGTIKSRVNRARSRLFSVLEVEDDDDLRSEPLIGTLQAFA